MNKLSVVVKCTIVADKEQSSFTLFIDSTTKSTSMVNGLVVEDVEKRIESTDEKLFSTLSEAISIGIDHSSDNCVTLLDANGKEWIIRSK